MFSFCVIILWQKYYEKFNFGNRILKAKKSLRQFYFISLMDGVKDILSTEKSGETLFINIYNFYGISFNTKVFNTKRLYFLTRNLFNTKFLDFLTRNSDLLEIFCVTKIHIKKTVLKRLVLKKFVFKIWSQFLHRNFFLCQTFLDGTPY